MNTALVLNLTERRAEETAKAQLICDTEKQIYNVYRNEALDCPFFTDNWIQLTEDIVEFTIPTLINNTVKFNPKLVDMRKLAYNNYINHINK